MTSTLDSDVRHGEYRLRTDADVDHESFCSLYETVWGNARSERWFEWRFEDVPVGDAARMAVAVDDGDVVAVQPRLPYRVRAGETAALALQPADWLVHPDHRGQGLCSRLTEHLLDRDADAAFYFNFPSAALKPLLDDLGWRTVGRPRTFYRIQDPETLADVREEPTAVTAAASVADAALDGYYGLLSRRRESPADVTVDRHDDVPADDLATLYRDAVPDRIHVVRDEAYYRWRFANPRWDVRTYVARRSGSPVAALVAATEPALDATITVLADALPLSGGPTDAFAALVEAAIADHADAAVLKASADPVPEALLRNAGFRADDDPVLSRFASQTTHVARPLAVDGWRFGGQGIDDSRDWHLALGEQDIA